jgi:hypothetical protein
VEHGYVPPLLVPSTQRLLQPLNAVPTGIFVFGAAEIPVPHGFDDKMKHPGFPLPQVQAADGATNLEARVLQDTIRVLKEAREKNARARGFLNGKGNGKGGVIARNASSSSNQYEEDVPHDEQRIPEHFCLDSDHDSDSGGEYLRQLRKEEAQRIADGGTAAEFSESDSGSPSDEEGESGDDCLQGPRTDAAEARVQGGASVATGESDDESESGRLSRKFFVQPKD